MDWVSNASTPKLNLNHIKIGLRIERLGVLFRELIDSK